jgi:hypothetical protein
LTTLARLLAFLSLLCVLQADAAPAGPTAVTPGKGLVARLYRPASARGSLSGVRRQATALTPEAWLLLPLADFKCGSKETLAEALSGSAPLAPTADLQRPVGEGFYLEARGYLNVLKAGAYPLTIRADDGFRLVIGGATVAEAEQEAWGKTFEATVRFPAPGMYPILIEFFQGSGDAQLQIRGEPFVPGALHDRLPGAPATQAAFTPKAQYSAQGPLGAQVVLTNPSPGRDGQVAWYAAKRRLGTGPRTTALLPPGEHEVMLERIESGGRALTTSRITVGAAVTEGESPVAVPRRIGPVPTVRGNGVFGRVWDVRGDLEDFEDVDRATAAEPAVYFYTEQIDYPPGPDLTVEARNSLQHWLGGAQPVDQKRDGRIFESIGDIRALEVTSCLRIHEPGEVTFDVNSDDGFQLWIGGILVSQHSTPRAPGWTTGKIRFPEAGLYPLRLRYFQWKGGAGLTLTSSLPDTTEALGPQGRRVVGKARLYQFPPGNHPPRPRVRVTRTAAAQGILGTQVLLDASGTSDPDGHPLELTWWLGDRRLGSGEKLWALAPLGSQPIRLEAWDGGPPVQVAGVVTVAPRIEGTSFIGGVFKKGAPVALSFRLTAEDGETVGAGQVRCEATVRRLTASGTELVGTRERRMAYRNGRWEHLFSGGPGRYRVEVRVLGLDGSPITQSRGEIVVR